MARESKLPWHQCCSNRHTPPTSINRGGHRGRIGGLGEELRHESQCKPAASACQPREPSLFPPADTRAPQPVQHSSAFIFISGGAVSCHDLGGESTAQISPSCVRTNRTQDTGSTCESLPPVLSWLHLMHTHERKLGKLER